MQNPFYFVVDHVINLTFLGWSTIVWHNYFLDHCYFVFALVLYDTMSCVKTRLVWYLWWYYMMHILSKLGLSLSFILTYHYHYPLSYIFVLSFSRVLKLNTNRGIVNTIKMHVYITMDIYIYLWHVYYHIISCHTHLLCNIFGKLI